MFTYIIKRLILDTIYFPLWWYSRGFIKVARWAGKSLIAVEQTASLKLWLKSMFKPMFQDYTKEGRIISFFMRLILLIFKLVGVGAWAVILLALIIAWLALPIGTVWLIIASSF